MLLVGVGVLLVLALAAGLLFLRQRDRADEAARTAQTRQLASDSALALEEDPERSILLALEAVDVSRSAGEPALPEALGALQTAVQTSRVVLRRDDGAFVVDASPDGALVASRSLEPATAIIWNAVTGEMLGALTDPGQAEVWDLGFSPDGHLLAVTYAVAEANGTSPVVVVWDPATGEQVSRIFGPDGAYGSPTFSPDGRLLAAANDEGRVMVWDLASTAERSSFAPESRAGSIEFLPDGQFPRGHPAVARASRVLLAGRS